MNRPLSTQPSDWDQVSWCLHPLLNLWQIIFDGLILGVLATRPTTVTPSSVRTVWLLYMLKQKRIDSLHQLKVGLVADPRAEISNCDTVFCFRFDFDGL